MASQDNMKVVIIGGGPAGLTAAYELSKSSVPVVVLEKDPVVGGLARTVDYKGYRQFLKPISNLQLVGRNGMHKYNNQDHAMLTAWLAAKNILGAHYDLWKVNVEQKYHEEIQADEADEKLFLEIAATQPKVPERLT